MTDREKTLDRIQKLMRLAINNPNRHEAECAALQAVTLIVEHKFVVSDNVQPAVTGGGLVDHLRRAHDAAARQQAYAEQRAAAEQVYWDYLTGQRVKR